MPAFAFILLLISSIMIGIMSILRKEYQITNGTKLSATLFFSLCASVIGFVFGVVSDFKGLSFDFRTLAFGCVYAIIATATASICIYGTAFGNVSTLLLWAMLGSLVLPSVFGVITQPDINRLTIFKGLGFLMALICILINFVFDKDKEKSNIRFKILCAIVFFTQGSALIIFNLKTRFCHKVSDMGFVATYMFFTVLLTLLVLVFMAIKNRSVIGELRRTITLRSVALMIGYAILFLGSEVIALKCAGLIPLIMQAPISFCIPIITTAAMDYIVYKTKLNKSGVLQIVFACLCCACFIFA